MTDRAKSQLANWPEQQVWSALVSRVGGAVPALAGFCVAYTVLVFLGYEFKEDASELTIFWPSAGLLVVVLWLSRSTYWPAIIISQVSIELVFAATRLPHLSAMTPLFMLANSIDGVVGALVARAIVKHSLRLSFKQALRVMLATGCGATAGALVGAMVTSMSHSRLDYLHDFQLWLAAYWMGSIVVVPVILAWVLPYRNRYPTLQLRTRKELLVFAVLVVGLTAWVFGRSPGADDSVLQMPVIIAAILLVGAFRLPPRWTVTLVAVAVLVAVYLAARGAGPFIVAADFTRIARLQMFLGMVAGCALLVAVILGEMRITNWLLVESERRYRLFVEHSAEAVWRVEVEPPMPLSLARGDQIDWLHAHAHVAEASPSFDVIDPAERVESPRRWRSGVPWSATFEQHLERAARQEFALADIRFGSTIDGKLHTFLASFSGVVRSGHLHRIWGAARDVTELVSVNAQLLHEQSRLRRFARQMVVAEERARRATAVDLHDGIGQALVGIDMTLHAARAQAPSQVQALLDAATGLLRDVQTRTRHVIADLSPPGLYDLGLGPALQWLAEFMHSHGGLRVDLDCAITEENVPVEARVLMFKVVRELLRNVAKHAGVDRAQVSVRAGLVGLHVRVSDEGKGFEWPQKTPITREANFGLVSVAERMREAGGKFLLNSTPGGGTRVDLLLPLAVRS
jgi:signal transduction histidine kinase